jgi:cyclophilin family peptidyl-prolyl cis-trans isomerase
MTKLRRSFRIELVLAFTLSWLVPDGFAAYTNGIYAEFNTSMGSYTCRLEYALAPRTCANFIGLATGQRSWLDVTTGLTKTNPLYSGVIFHRVVSNFVIQAGSPTGLGDGGPGYAIRNEFNSAIRHSKFGILSMANAGPDTAGSQFFVTVRADASLDDNYSAFGRLYGGSNVVYKINRVATDANEKPLTNVVLNVITIRRVGAAAIGFDINTNGLPLVTNLNVKIAGTPTNLGLTFSNRLYADNRIYDSTTLTQWNGTKLGYNIVAPILTNVSVTPSLPKQFFRMAQVQYPILFVPRTVFNKTLTLNFSNNNGTFVVSFDGNGGGNYTWSQGSSNTLNTYTWMQDIYRGRFLPIIFNGNGLPAMNLDLGYTNATAGTFIGTAYPFYPLSINAFGLSGTFSSTP